MLILISVKCLCFQERMPVLLSKQFWQLYCRNWPWSSLLPHCMLRRVAYCSQLDWNTLFCLSYSRKCFFLSHMKAQQYSCWHPGCLSVMALVACLDAGKTEISFQLKIPVLFCKISWVYSWRVFWLNRRYLSILSSWSLRQLKSVLGIIMHQMQLFFIKFSKFIELSNLFFLIFFWVLHWKYH